MDRTYLTDTRLRALPPAARRYEVWDAAVPNLLVRVGTRGKKVFALHARFGGAASPTRRKIGNYPKISLARARTIAAEWNTMIGHGTDPREAERQTLRLATAQRKYTFRAVQTLYRLPSRRWEQDHPSDGHATNIRLPRPRAQSRGSTCRSPT
jgi:Arm DNA-binding domain